jgi:hypothetical protein
VPGAGSFPVVIALAVVAVIFLVTVPWVGVALGIVALILLVVALVGGAKARRERA